MDITPVKAPPPPTDTVAGPPPAEAPRLHVPLQVRSLALVVLALLAVLYTMRWASAVIVPVLLGLMLSHALGPLVDRLERLRLPRALGAAVLLMSLVGGFGWTAYSLSDDATELLDALPAATAKVRAAMAANRPGSNSPLAQVQKAATQLEQAATAGGPAATTVPRGATRVVIERPHFNLHDYLWTGTMGLLASLGQATVVVFIAFFLLASGNHFRRKLVHLAGPTFAERRLTVQTLDEIGTQVQRYLLVQVITSVVVGVATWLAFLAVGMDHAAVWGVVAFVLNFIPYVGAIALLFACGLMAFVQFGSVDMVLLVTGISLGLHILSGNLLMPWLSSRTSRMNAVTVFVGVLAFGWLWGLWGLLLGVPILASVKAVCDRVEELKPVGELMST
ncbi:AI-2E family transporter [Roseateles sp. LYH14W]|uniref:AI-2E family transporter n=1 Tax=Pelomonas parva TaxID=3299032 RepID=A0ABW7F0U7_9BURK